MYVTWGGRGTPKGAVTAKCVPVLIPHGGATADAHACMSHCSHYICSPHYNAFTRVHPSSRRPTELQLGPYIFKHLICGRI